MRLCEFNRSSAHGPQVKINKAGESGSLRIWDYFCPLITKPSGVSNQWRAACFWSSTIQEKIEVVGQERSYPIIGILALCRCLLYPIATSLKRIGIYSRLRGVELTLFQQLRLRTGREGASCFAIARCEIIVYRMELFVDVTEDCFVFSGRTYSQCRDSAWLHTHDSWMAPVR